MPGAFVAGAFVMPPHITHCYEYFFLCGIRDTNLLCYVTLVRNMWKVNMIHWSVRIKLTNLVG